MDRRKLLTEALTLPAEERIELAGALWDSIGDKDLPLSDELKQELDRRLGHLERDSGTTIPWEQVKAEILAELKSK